MNRKQREIFANGMIQIATAAVATLTFGEAITGRHVRYIIVILGVIAAVVFYGAAYLLLDIDKQKIKKHG